CVPLMQLSQEGPGRMGRKRKRVVNGEADPPLTRKDDSTSAEMSPESFWGSYRPQVYFGMKTRSPRSVVTGMTWMRQFSGVELNLRNTCEQGDGLQGYGWLMHDGLSFGEHGGDWTWRITAKQHSSAPHAPVISLMFYAAANTQGSLEAHVEERNRLGSITGFSEELGNFKITFRKFLLPSGWFTFVFSPPFLSYNYLQTLSPGLERLTDIVRNSLNRRFVYSPPSGEQRHYIAVDTYKPLHQPKPSDPRKESDFVLHQVTVQTPFQIEVLFESGSFRNRPNQLSAAAMTEERKAAFDAKFEKTFSLQAKGLDHAQVKFSKAALSNMLGGMGYFYGQSVVQSVYNEYPVLYPEGALFTAVPSRSFSPRGFLWDEGFHQLLLSKWDPQVTRKATAHWLDLVNMEGWIPQEQILGDEARSKVPAEFVVHRNENGNPPTLFLALQKLVEQLQANPDAESSRPTLPFLRRLYPRLKTWFEWYNTTQTGPLPNSYRWRGRDKDTNLFLNPKTLTSGLVDYPRASHPSAEERHVDLHCWMVLASGIMANVARLLGEPHQEYERTHQTLSDNALLDELHWSNQLRSFSDYGNHTQAVSLQQEKVYVPPGQPRHQFPVARLVRSVRRAPKPQFVNALGYISLFPFLLHVLMPDSPKLEHIFRDMRDADKLWTPYGLRSLSRSDPLYVKRNTEHDAPYWLGPIWININYLAVRALHHYGNTEGPYQEKAAALYQELRTNIMNNVYRQYAETGGQGSHPFTGWSALTVLIMAEQY
uniref:Mannosyl-oligosaccharide glucosidase n=1 Tax=Hucho hucho TaxID=62062 RepID=A0A4W5Q9M4_9TELE